jgi:hypothetical protein
MKIAWIRRFLLIICTLPLMWGVICEACLLYGPANPDLYLTEKRRDMSCKIAKQLRENALHSEDGIAIDFYDGNLPLCMFGGNDSMFRFTILRSVVTYIVHDDSTIGMETDINIATSKRLLAFYGVLFAVFFCVIHSRFIVFIMHCTDSLIGFAVICSLLYAILVVNALSLQGIIADGLRLYRLLVNS